MKEQVRQAINWQHYSNVEEAAESSQEQEEIEDDHSVEEAAESSEDENENVVGVEELAEILNP